MAQTPVSISANIASLTPTTLYTVGSGKTAIVSNVTASTAQISQGVTLNKVKGGVTYPITQNRQISPTTPATGASAYYGSNLLTGSITLEAGDSLTMANGALNPTFPIVASSNYPTSLLTGSPFNGTTYYQATQIQYANGTYLAVGYNTGGTSIWPANSGFVATSPDGITWTGRPNFPAGQANLIAVEYGPANTWVAIGGDGTTYAACWYSTDNGVNWSKVSLTSTLTETKSCTIAYVNSTFLIGTTNGQLFSSTDGITWTNRAGYNALALGRANDSNQANQILSIGYINSTYIFGTYGATVTSTDLTTFIAPYSYGVGAMTFYAGLTGIAYRSTGATWYIAGIYQTNTVERPTLFKSTDGINWSWISTLTGNIFASAAPYVIQIQTAGSATGIYLMPDGGYADITFSTDNGATWTKSASRANGGIGPVVGLSNGYFLSFKGCADYGNSTTGAQITTNPAQLSGTNSTTGNAPQTYNGCAGASNGTEWVVFYYAEAGAIHRYVGTSGTNISNPGTTGISVSNGLPLGAGYLSSTNKYYLALTSGRVYSCTGISGGLTLIATIPALATYGYGSMCVIGSKLVLATGANTVLTSTDGITWTQLTVPTFANGGGTGYTTQGIATDGTTAVIPYATGQVITTDGSTLSTSTALWGLKFQQTVNGLSFGYFAGQVPAAYANSLFTITNINNSGAYTYRTSSWSPPNVGYQTTNSTFYTGKMDSIVYAGSTYYFPKDQSGYFSSTNLNDFTDYTFANNNNSNGTAYIPQGTYPFFASNGTNMVVTNRGSSTLQIAAQPLTNGPSFGTPVSVNLGAVEIT